MVKHQFVFESADDKNKGDTAQQYIMALYYNFVSNYDYDNMQDEISSWVSGATCVGTATDGPRTNMRDGQSNRKKLYMGNSQF